MADKWFDYSTYMANKRAQLNAADPSANWTAEQVADAFEQAGFKGVDGAQQHFEQYGHTAEENLSPNANFIPSQYYIFKAADYFDKAVADVTEEQAAYIQAAIKDAGMSAWDHYTQYGTKEGINPSNNFDTQKYLEAKLEALKAEDAEKYGDWTTEDVAKAFEEAGMNALEHAMQYSGEENEAPAAFDANGKPTGAYEVENPVDAGDGETYELTAGIDDLPGTTGDDTFNASGDASVLLGGLDVIGGKGGSDTFNIADSRPAAATDFSFNDMTINDTVKTINLTTNLQLGGTAQLDMSGYTGVGKLVAKTANAAKVDVKVADDTAVDLTTAANNVTVDVTGGKSVALTAKDATTVTLTSNTLAEVTLGGQFNNAQTVTVANTTANHDLALNLNGYVKADGTAGSVTDAAAKTMTITATGDASNVALTGAALDTISVSDSSSGALTLDLAGATALTGFDGGAATGALTLTGIAGTVKTLSTGSGKDSVAIANAMAAGTNINLGDDNDSLLYANGTIAASTASATTVVDGGAGDDTVAMALIGSANVASFKNFEYFDAADLDRTFDADLLAANNTIKGIITSADVKTNAVIENLGTGVSFTNKATMANALTLTQKTPGALTITTDEDDIAANTASAVMANTNGTTLNLVFDNGYAAANAGNDVTATIAATSATTLNVTSGGENINSNILVFTGGAKTADVDTLTTVKIDGDAKLEFTYTKAATASGITTVDAAGMTDGGLTFTADAKAGSATNSVAAGATIKLGGGDDKITLTADDDSAGNANNVLKIEGLKFGTAASATTQDDFDVISMTGALHATAISAVDATVMSVANNKVSWVGSGPSSLADAIAKLIDNAHGVGKAANNNGALVFDYNGTVYLYGTGADATSATDDFLVQLSGVTIDQITGVDVTSTAGEVYVY